MSGDFIERLVDGQLLSRMTELEAELATERAINDRLRAAGDALAKVAAQMGNHRLGRHQTNAAIAVWQEARNG